MELSHTNFKIQKPWKTKRISSLNLINTLIHHLPYSTHALMGYLDVEILSHALWFKSMKFYIFTDTNRSLKENASIFGTVMKLLNIHQMKTFASTMKMTIIIIMEKTHPKLALNFSIQFVDLNIVMNAIVILMMEDKLEKELNLFHAIKKTGVNPTSKALILLKL